MFVITFNVMFRFDTEIQLLTDELRQEKSNKERATREKEMALADKYTMEQNLSVSCPHLA